MVSRYLHTLQTAMLTSPLPSPSPLPRLPNRPPRCAICFLTRTCLVCPRLTTTLEPTTIALPCCHPCCHCAQCACSPRQLLLSPFRPSACAIPVHCRPSAQSSSSFSSSLRRVWGCRVPFWGYCTGSPTSREGYAHRLVCSEPRACQVNCHLSDCLGVRLTFLSPARCRVK